MLVLEHQEVFVQFILLLLHSRGGSHSPIKHLHQITRISRVRLVCVQTEQVFRDILQVRLQNSTPLVPQTKLLKVLRSKFLQVNCSRTNCASKTVDKFLLFIFVSCRNARQVDFKVFVVLE